MVTVYAMNSQMVTVYAMATLRVMAIVHVMEYVMVRVMVTVMVTVMFEKIQQMNLMNPMSDELQKATVTVDAMDEQHKVTVRAMVHLMLVINLRMNLMNLMPN